MNKDEGVEWRQSGHDGRFIVNTIVDLIIPGFSDEMTIAINGRSTLKMDNP